jgi:hypothetical protein
MKTAVEALYNNLKGGLDSNSQQFQAILPPIKISFEQIYVILLLISSVINAWRAQQLLQQPIEPGSAFSLHLHRKLLVNQCSTLKDFNYKIAMALIQRSTDNTSKMFWWPITTKALQRSRTKCLLMLTWALYETHQHWCSALVTRKCPKDNNIVSSPIGKICWS